MRWKIGDCVFDGLTRRVQGVAETTLGRPDACVLEVLIKHFEKKCSDDQIILEAWERSVSMNSLSKAIQHLRDAFGGERDSYIATGPYHLVVAPEPLGAIESKADSPDGSNSGRNSISKGKNYFDYAIEGHAEVKRILSDSNEHAATRTLSDSILSCIPDSVLKFEGPPNQGNRLIPASTSTSDNFLLNAPPPVGDLSSQRGDFTLLIDGMIIDVVAELLMGDDSMNQIINRSRGTYIRCIEDFAFSLIYASSVTSAPDIVDRSKDPRRYSRAEITSQLGAVWHCHDLDRKLKKGAVLEDQKHRDIVRANIVAAGKCIMRHGGPFRDWLSGEVSRHLGYHDSLFEEGVSPDNLVFLNHDLLSHYRNPHLQEAFGVEATNRAIGFLRDAMPASERRHSTVALRQFATTSILGLVTVMHENDLSAADKKIFRMPHLLRSLVKQQVLLDVNIQQQTHLRKIVTRHALSAAFRQVQDIDRRSLITVFLNLRGESPFKEVRAILQEHKLLLLQPTEQHERRAQSILKEIYRLADPRQAHSEVFTMDQINILRTLKKCAQSDFYVHQLHRVFPALSPRRLSW